MPSLIASVGGKKVHVVLVEPEIPANTGNIARLCVATGSVLHLIRPLGFFLTDPRLKRAGLDYWQYLKLHTYNRRFSPGSESRRMFFVETGGPALLRGGYRSDDYLVSAAKPRLLRLCWNATGIFEVTLSQRDVRSQSSNTVAIVVYEAWRQLNFVGEKSHLAGFLLLDKNTQDVHC